jgi:hypothetical protein
MAQVALLVIMMANGIQLNVPNVAANMLVQQKVMIGSVINVVKSGNKFQEVK